MFFFNLNSIFNIHIDIHVDIFLTFYVAASHVLEFNR